MRRALRLGGIALGVLFLALQALPRPDRVNPPVDARRAVGAYRSVPGEVDAILRRACYDCHSNETVWPWYSLVQPVAWFLGNHVEHGRRQVNFSEWPSDPAEAAKRLPKCCEEVEHGYMPLASYLPLHPEARLSPEDVKTICAWTRAPR